VRVSGPTHVRKGRIGRYRATVGETNTGGRITSRTWRLGRRVVGRGTTLTHRFRKRGTFSITLTVADDSGLSARSNTVRVRVRKAH
jgi:hypothetical protein